MIISTVRIDVITKKKFYILRKKGIQKPKSLGVCIFAPLLHPLVHLTPSYFSHCYGDWCHALFYGANWQGLFSALEVLINTGVPVLCFPGHSQEPLYTHASVTWKSRTVIAHGITNRRSRDDGSMRLLFIPTRQFWDAFHKVPQRFLQDSGLISQSDVNSFLLFFPPYCSLLSQPCFSGSLPKRVSVCKLFSFLGNSG